MKPKHMQETRLKSVMTPPEKSVQQKVELSSLNCNIPLSVSETRLLEMSRIEIVYCSKSMKFLAKKYLPYNPITKHGNLDFKCANRPICSVFIWYLIRLVQ